MFKNINIKSHQHHVYTPHILISRALKDIISNAAPLVVAKFHSITTKFQQIVYTIIAICYIYYQLSNLAYIFGKIKMENTNRLLLNDLSNEKLSFIQKLCSFCGLGLCAILILLALTTIISSINQSFFGVIDKIREMDKITRESYSAAILTQYVKYNNDYIKPNELVFCKVGSNSRLHGPYLGKNGSNTSS